MRGSEEIHRKDNDGYKNMFNKKPLSKYKSPLEKGDHPELETAELLDEDGMHIYQSLIGSLQWSVLIGSIDIATSVMSLSSYKSTPRIGHLERAKRVVVYLSKMKEAKLRFRVSLPDYSNISYKQYDWEKSVYWDTKEALLHDIPTALGKPVIMTHYVAANLYHYILTGRSVTGIFHFLNKTPIDWFSKKQATSETATYGSEFVAARTCVEKIIDLRTTLGYLGVKTIGSSYMFEHNESVVLSSIYFTTKLQKRHNALSLHRVRESITTGICRF